MIPTHPVLLASNYLPIRCLQCPCKVNFAIDSSVHQAARAVWPTVMDWNLLDVSLREAIMSLEGEICEYSMIHSYLEWECHPHILWALLVHTHICKSIAKHHLQNYIDCANYVFQTLVPAFNDAQTDTTVPFLYFLCHRSCIYDYSLPSFFIINLLHMVCLQWPCKVNFAVHCTVYRAARAVWPGIIDWNPLDVSLHNAILSLEGEIYGCILIQSYLEW